MPVDLEMLGTIANNLANRNRWGAAGLVHAAAAEISELRSRLEFVTSERDLFRGQRDILSKSMGDADRILTRELSITTASVATSGVAPIG